MLNTFSWSQSIVKVLQRRGRCQRCEGRREDVNLEDGQALEGQYEEQGPLDSMDSVNYSS